MMTPVKSSMYALQDVPGKGKGLVATRNIPKGTRILSEKALLSFPGDLHGGEDQLKQIICQKVRALNSDQQDAFLSLHNVHPFKDFAEQYIGIVRTNSLPTQNKPQRSVIFLEACRINHNCENNAVHQWNDNIKRGTLHAMRDIHSGEEITISYVFSLTSRENRQSTFKKYFNFTCSCRLCSLPEDLSHERDRKLEQIVHLDHLGALQPIISPLQTLGYFYSQTRLYIELGREDIGFAEAHEEAASLVIAYGDLARGRAFAEKILPIWTTVAGSDSSRAIYYKTLARDPWRGDRYGFSMRWNTSVDEIPQGLAPDDFENWLWKREPPISLAKPTNPSNRSFFSSVVDLPYNTHNRSPNVRHSCFLPVLSMGGMVWYDPSHHTTPCLMV
ncbi:hypothetical protein E4U09_003558 [Claviceps aff. purpurea]|uniref:SET domain-containing protein n=1 Tax=Claviceps aff. purpurea TaxID=1967640 RepID=A0A9P7QGW6_9HYPO|nr:hypothetical protein E4U09_003558 [Claviceps aff. purpurea]